MDRDSEDGRRMKPARGGAKSDSAAWIWGERQPRLDELDERDEAIEEDELLGDKLGVDGDRRGIGMAAAGMMTPDLRRAAREKAGALLSAKAGADLGGGTGDAPRREGEAGRRCSDPARGDEGGDAQRPDGRCEGAGRGDGGMRALEARAEFGPRAGDDRLERRSR